MPPKRPSGDELNGRQRKKLKTQAARDIDVQRTTKESQKVTFDCESRIVSKERRDSCPTSFKGAAFLDRRRKIRRGNAAYTALSYSPTRALQARGYEIQAMEKAMKTAGFGRASPRSK